MQRQGFNVAGIGDLLAGVLAAGDGVTNAADVVVATAPSSNVVIRAPVKAGVVYGFFFAGIVNVTSLGNLNVLSGVFAGSGAQRQVSLMALDGAGSMTFKTGVATGLLTSVLHTPTVTGNRAVMAAGTITSDVDTECYVATSTSGAMVTLRGSSAYIWRLR
jgi:hypothetical protein